MSDLTYSLTFINLAPAYHVGQFRTPDDPVTTS